MVDESEVVVGSNLQLTCPAFGVPLPTVKWFKEDKAIKENSTKYTLIQDGLVCVINYFFLQFDSKMYRLCSHSTSYSQVVQRRQGY